MMNGRRQKIVFWLLGWLADDERETASNTSLTADETARDKDTRPPFFRLLVVVLLAVAGFRAFARGNLTSALRSWLDVSQSNISIRPKLRELSHRRPKCKQIRKQFRGFRSSETHHSLSPPLLHVFASWWLGNLRTYWLSKPPCRPSARRGCIGRQPLLA